MWSRTGCWGRATAAAGLVFAVAAVAGASAQVISEDFDAVTGTGGGAFMTDADGFYTTPQWDDGIAGEGAFAGATGTAVIGTASADGDPTGGVDGSGAGVITVDGVRYHYIGENFENITTTGSSDFITDPFGANTVANWDDGIAGESAFAYALAGASFGSAVAEGVAGLGVDGSAAGRLSVSNVTLNAGDWSAGLSFAAPLPTGKPVNTSFEDLDPNAGGDRPDGYFAWGNAWAVAADPGTGLVPRTGDRMMKFWGNWSGAWNTSAVGQMFPSQEGDVWEADCWTKHITGDNLVGTQNYVLLQIEFLNANGDRITVEEHTVLNGTSPLDTWIDVPAFQATAPAGTVNAQCVIMFLQPNFEGGAAQADDLSFHRVSGPPALDTSAFALYADVQGAAAAGQSLGDYVLRLEDADSDALAFYGTANGSFQALGGLLYTAAQAAGAGPDADGVFDPDSSAYTVTLAFADPALTWGTGGNLIFDNLVVASDPPPGSAWYAGLYWENLTAPAALDLSQTLLRADVQGDVIGGDYQLRLEAFIDQVVENVDDDFSAATGTGGGQLLAFDSTEATFYVTNWDDGITGEAAYGGIFGDAELCEPAFCPEAGFWVQTTPDGGVAGGPAAQLRVDNVIYDTGGWYAGLNWPNQVLPANPDLSQIALTADIKGEAHPFGGPLGEYELRLEDPQNDRLYFRMTATGNWQSVGGTLDMASNGPALDGNGDGVFDLNASDYKVTVSFVDETATWWWGGTLTVDNLFLTSGTRKREIGRVSFSQSADGSFQRVGGLLSDGVLQPERMEFAEDFSTATGTGGGVFVTPSGGDYTPSFDDGIEHAEAFAGVWGGAVVNGGVSAEACLDCGVGGTPAARIDVDDITVAASSNGWWAGMSFVDLHPVMFDPAQVTLTADIKGIADDPGETLGTITLRIEDPELDFLEFTVTANGTFQPVGGLLSTATPGAAGGGDGVINKEAEWYHVAVVLDGNGSNWGAGATLIVDNLQLDGITLADADHFTVVTTFEHEVATWGPTGGVLTVDNLLMTEVGHADCDLDTDVDLMDFANFQACFGQPAAGACVCADLDLNGNIDLMDLEIFELQFTGP